jgi:transposase-like protein
MRGDGYVCGSRHPKAKLDEKIVALVRSSRDTTAELARRFNVTKKTLRQARLGRTWQCVPLK